MTKTAFRADSAARLAQAVRAAQTGRIVEARAIAEAALTAGGEATPLHAFLGMLCAREGDLATAVIHLQAALAERPDDITIACNCISVLLDLGRDEEALAIATAQRAEADQSLRIARYRAYIAQKLEQFEVAAQLYARIVACTPNDIESWNNLGNARAALDDSAGAIEALTQAMALDPLAAPTRINLAHALAAAGRPDDAIATLRQAASDFSGDAQPLRELYLLLKRLNRSDDVLPVLEEAAKRASDDADLQLKLAIEYGFVHRTADAELAFRRAIALNPKMGDAYLGLAIQYEHSNREAEFAPLMALGRANGLDEGPLSFIAALEHRRRKEFDLGLQALEAVPAEIEPERVAHVRATLLDRLGRSDEAFENFLAANRLIESKPHDPIGRAAALRRELAEEIEIMTPEWFAGWRDATIQDSRPDPVFLVGFPRSGTTLLDTIVMGHPKTVVLEEKPPLNHTDRMLGGLSALPQLSDDEIREARDFYFSEVAAIHPLPAGHLLIDKSPLFLYKLPLIRRLFPRARIILALRHPCDVLLSCFMSNFRPNSAMANFLRIEDGAAFYDLVFSHWKTASSQFAMPVHTVVYERLIENVETEVRPLFDWLDLEWHAEALDHQRTAKSRGLITTASYSQVIEPIYNRAAGRWQRYRRHLDPVLPVLEPWVEAFGYTLDPA